MILIARYERFLNYFNTFKLNYFNTYFYKKTFTNKNTINYFNKYYSKIKTNVKIIKIIEINIHLIDRESLFAIK